MSNSQSDSKGAAPRKRGQKTAAPSPFVDVTEQKRLNEAREAGIPWKKWGPYLSERQWGTVREDYSQDGNAWAYFSHDQSRARAYRWGEDGIGGFSDDEQRLCFALALWNERDPILKERLFGVTNSEGNHGEDVKECYFYVDATPTHSYMKYLYKYPQREFPYRDLVETNQRRSRQEFEYELIDTGIFDDDRYFDVFLEYAKGGPDDILIRVTVHNRGPEAARLHLLPTLWFRNTWSWKAGSPKPSLREADGAIRASHPELGDYTLTCDGAPELLFTENETNAQRLWDQPNASPWVKDAFHQYVVSGNSEAINPAQTGTKAAARYVLDVPAGGSAVVRLRLSSSSADAAPAQAAPAAPFGEGFDATVAARLADADEFYNRITPPSLSEDERRVHRQALAGMLWGKQYYLFDVDTWLKEHEAHPLVGVAKRKVRNAEWFHMFNGDIISMPDKWEYPWYAAWDLAFHTIALALVDFDFAKEQLLMLLRSLYFHPNGQIPAYEWNFSDVNPPVHAWATLYLYKVERDLGREDIEFLERSFQGLMLNFNWWVNRKDPQGRNVFAGGFLGLDNIGVFDRSAPLPTGGSLEQADGTAWMAFYCQNMIEMALILADHDPQYEEYAFNFLQHFMWIAYAMDRIGDQHDEMWDETDGFFYDVLRLPDGSATAPEGPLHGGAAPALRQHDLRAGRPHHAPQADGADRAVPRAPSRGRGAGRADGRRLQRLRRTPAAVPALEEAARTRPGLPPGRKRVPEPLRHPVALPLPPGTPVRLRRRRPGLQRLLRAGRVEHGDVRRQLELAGAGLDARQRAHRPRAPEPLRFLRRRLHRRVPHRLRQPDDALRGGGGDLAAARQHLPQGRGRFADRPPTRLRRHCEVPG